MEPPWSYRGNPITLSALVASPDGGAPLSVRAVTCHTPPDGLVWLTDLGCLDNPDLRNELGDLPGSVPTPDVTPFAPFVPEFGEETDEEEEIGPFGLGTGFESRVPLLIEATFDDGVGLGFGWLQPLAWLPESTIFVEPFDPQHTLSLVARGDRVEATLRVDEPFGQVHWYVDDGTLTVPYHPPGAATIGSDEGYTVSTEWTPPEGEHRIYVVVESTWMRPDNALTFGHVIFDQANWTR